MMENHKLGNTLIIIGIIIAIVPLIVIPALAYYTQSLFGTIGSIVPYVFLITGIIIAITGQILRKKD